MASDSRREAETARGAGKEKVSTALKNEEKVISTWYILGTDGKLTGVEKFDFSKHRNLKRFADYEIKKVRAYSKVPEHIRLMQKLRLVGYEPGSDAGNMRFYPNGRLIKSLIERYVTEMTVGYGAVEVETPIMYDYQHPAFKSYLERFPARHYVVRSDDKEFFLRFAACFGQFLIMHDTTISYKQLPLKVYELARYSFRREKSGEVTGLKRLRAFTMPDMHTVCGSFEQAKGEFNSQFDLCMSVLDGIGIKPDEYEAAIRFTEEFWEGNKDFVRGIVRDKLGKPALIETWNFRYAYFDPKFEFNVIDSMDKATALSTVQIDHENGERYKVTYVDERGGHRGTTILHCSPSGAIERVIYGLLELSGVKAKKGGTPSFPLWLAPTQVRLLSVADKHIGRCVELASKLTGAGIRADVDDTDETLDKKVRNAELEWIPYVAVIGDREADTGQLSVRRRGVRTQEKLSAERLAEEIGGKTCGMPKERLSLPMLLSKRPVFPG